jgi:subtilisin family serine protease
MPRGFGRVTTVTEAGNTFPSNDVEFTPTTSSAVSGPLIECALADTTASCPTKPEEGPWIALINRGAITFGAKVQNVMAQGASAAIIANNDTANRDDAGNFTLGAAGAWIPTVSVSYSSGVSIRRQGLAPGSVEVTGVNHDYLDGTSMATPHASAVAALAWSVNRSLSNAQIRAILSSTATDLGKRGHDDLYGNGFVQADAAVAAALATSP